MNKIVKYLQYPYIEVTLERKSLIELVIGLVMVGAILILLNKALK